MSALLLGSERVLSQPAAFECDTRYETCKSLYKEKSFSESAALLLRTLQLHPECENAEMHLLLGRCYLSLSKLDKAEEEFRVVTLSFPSTKPAASALEELFLLKQAKEKVTPSDSAGVQIRILTDSSDLKAPETQQPLVSNIFFETDVRQVLTDISQQTGIPIIADNTVQGLVTYEAVEVPLEEALVAVLAPLGYSYRWTGTYYLVGTASPDQPSFVALSETRVYKPDYLKAEEIKDLLSSFYEPYISLNKETNTMTVTGSPQLLARFEEDVAKIDYPPGQVMIEAMVMEVSHDVLVKLGIDWSAVGTAGKQALGVVTEHTNVLDKSLGIDYAESDFKIGKYRFDLTSTLEALVQTGDADIRANPSISTLDGQKATIDIGREEWFELITTGYMGYQYANLQAIKSGIILNITPYIASGGEITVKVEPEVSDVTARGATGYPVISKRSVSTTVRVRDGETITIGGLAFHSKTVIRKKIPLLGSIPLLGYIFRYNEEEKEHREVVVFITPHILEMGVSR
jgi:type IV pilus assembly protein PilQ